MSFYRTDELNNVIRNRQSYRQPDDEIIRVEQSHKDEVNITNIVKRHGIDLLQRVSAMQQFTYDDNPNNDFSEVMNAVIKAKDSFANVPSDIRKQFDNDPAQFMDFIYNPDNKQAMIDMGLANAETITPPIQVEVINTVADAAPPVVDAPPIVLDVR